MEEINLFSGSWKSEFWIPNRNTDNFIEPRPWQKEAFNKLKNERFRWVVAPPGSGKTTLMLMFAYNDIIKNDVEKVIIVVPQNSIKLNYNKKLIDMDGELFRINPKQIDNHSVTKLKQFLKNDLSNYKINLRVFVCTHQAMCRIDSTLLKDNIAIWVDEAHHLSDDVDNEFTNKLGSKISCAINNGASVNIATATPARHDRLTLVSDKNRAKFVELTYSIDRHIREHTEIEHLHFNILKFNETPEECITEVFDKSVEPTIIWLPPIGMLKLFGEECKYEFSRKLANAIFPKCKLINTKYGWKINDLMVVDLVSEEYRKEKLKFIKKNKIDVIIALEMFKEGDDYPRLSRGIKVGVRQSVVANNQMNGRLLRYYKNKNEIKIYQIIPNVDKNDPDIKQKVNKLISFMLLSTMDVELVLGSPKVVLEKKEYRIGHIWENTFGDKAICMKSDLIGDILAINDFDESRVYVSNWCERYNITDDNKIFASVLSYIARNTNAYNDIDNVVNLDLIDKDDMFGWYSKAIGVDLIESIKKTINDSHKIMNTFINMAMTGEPKPKSDIYEYNYYYNKHEWFRNKILSINKSWKPLESPKARSQKVKQEIYDWMYSNPRPNLSSRLHSAIQRYCRSPTPYGKLNYVYDGDIHSKVLETYPECLIKHVKMAKYHLLHIVASKYYKISPGLYLLLNKFCDPNDKLYDEKFTNQINFHHIMWFKAVEPFGKNEWYSKCYA